MNKDIAFVSYNEHNANDNWRLLNKRFPSSFRIDGVKGINNAYAAAAVNAISEYLYIVDADNEILPDFNFDFDPGSMNFSTYIFKARNPVNNLEYGYGGIKLYRTAELLKLRERFGADALGFMRMYDFPVTDHIKFLGTTASITSFNSSEFDSWKAAFRECCKLETFGQFMRLSEDQKKIDLDRQKIWMTVGKNSLFGEWVLEGAREGAKYGKKNKGDILKISLINDFNWLKKTFTEKYRHVLLK